MNELGKQAFEPIQVRRYVWALISAWTLAMAITLSWELLDERAKLMERSERAPLDGFARADETSEVLHRIVGYGSMWALGLLGIAFLSRHLQKQVEARRLAERELQETNLRLEDRVQDRTRNLADANQRLQAEMAERQLAERWLLESEERFRGCFEQGIFGMAILSPQKSLVEVNERLCQMLGYTPTELIEMPWTELIHPDDRQADAARFQRMVAGIVLGYTIESRILHKDGESQTVSLSVRLLRKEDRSVDCIIAFIQDLAERRYNAEELRVEGQRMT